MDLRKVQLTGGSSLTVTLPKAWVDKAKIRPGDVVGCSEQADGSLAIHPHVKGPRQPQRYVVEIQDESREYLFRKLVAAYLMGYDTIVVSSKRPLSTASRTAVRDAVRRIMGLEIVDEEPSAVTIQDFLDPREFHLDKALRRMSLLTQRMQEEALQILLHADPDALQSVADHDDEVDRLYWLVSKQYHAMLRDPAYAAKVELTSSQALNFLLVARLVERTADHAYRMAVQSLQIPRARGNAAIVERVERDGRKAAALFRESMQTFNRGDAKRANALVDEANAFLKNHERLLKDAAALGGETVSHLVYVIESIGRTAAYAANVGEVAINHKVALSP